jgi:phage protein D
MPVIPSDVSRQTPMFRIASNGTPLRIAASLVALDVRHDVAGSATAVLHFAVSPAAGGMDSAFLAAPLGAALEIALGHHDPLSPVFTGTVRAHRLQLASGGAPEMVLEAAASSAPVTPQDAIALGVQYGATLLAFDGERAVTASGIQVQGRVTLTGTAAAWPGQPLELSGTGDVFDGELRIVVVHQQVSHEGWRTHADVRSDEAPV